MRRAPNLGRRMVVLVNLSGRGDKDVDSVLEWDAERAAGQQEGTEVPVHPRPRKWGAKAASAVGEE